MIGALAVFLMAMLILYVRTLHGDYRAAKRNRLAGRPVSDEPIRAWRRPPTSDAAVPIALDPGIARAAPGPARELTMPVGWCAPAELQYELPEETTVGDLTSDLDGQLAAEEHRQGLGVVDGHCPDCDTKVRAAYREKGQRECSHDVTHRIMSMGGEVIVRACDRCGARLSVA